MALQPARLLDTRTGSGAPAHAVAPGGTVALLAAGRGGVPLTGVAAVSLNVTATAGSATGFVTVYPAGTKRPPSSNLNFTRGQVIANVVIAQLGTGGVIDLYNGSAGTVQLVADVSGYYTSGAPAGQQPTGAYVPMTPRRVLDTRTGLGAPRKALAPRQVLTVDVAGPTGVTDPWATSVVLNVTVISPTAAGVLTIYPSQTRRRVTSNLNWGSGQTIANLAVVQLRGDRTVDVYNNSSGTIELVVDVSGYFVHRGSVYEAGGYVPITPYRVLDTRIGQGAPGRPVAPGATVRLQVAGASELPPAGITAAVLNLTVTGATSAGFVTDYPDGARVPLVSSLNHTAGQTIAGLVTAPVGADGKVAFRNSSGGSIQLIADIAGYVTTDRPPPDLTWTAPATADPATGTLISISCAAATFCVAIDANGYAFRYSGGTQWSAGTPVLTGVHSRALSCPAAGFCVASNGPAVVTYDGSAWSPPATVDAGAVISSLSCTSTTSCVAVDDVGRVLTFNGTSWSSPVEVDASGLRAVSCVSGNWCMALDAQGYATTFDGSSWGVLVPLLTGSMSYAHLDCPTTTFCAASANSEVALFNGTSWSAPTPLAAPSGDTVIGVSCPGPGHCVAQTASGTGTWILTGATWSHAAGPAGEGRSWGVACVTASFCMEIGDTSEFTASQASVFDGASWGAPTTLDPIDSGHLTAVSCPTTTFCAAVDANGFATTFDGSSWARPSYIDPAAAASLNQPALTGISCPTATFCLAVSAEGTALSYNGSIWSAPAVVAPGRSLTAVSCVSAAFCQAADAGGGVHTLTDSTWTTTQLDPTQHPLNSVACASSSYCVVAGDLGQVLVWNGGSWSAAQTLSPSPISQVSCGAVGACAAITGGELMQLVDGRWTAPFQYPGINFSAISCSDASNCQGTDYGVAVPVADQVVGLPVSLTITAQAPIAISCATPTFCIAIASNQATVGS